MHIHEAIEYILTVYSIALTSKSYSNTFKHPLSCVLTRLKNSWKLLIYLFHADGRNFAGDGVLVEILNEKRYIVTFPYNIKLNVTRTST